MAIASGEFIVLTALVLLSWTLGCCRSPWLVVCGFTTLMIVIFYTLLRALSWI